MVGRRAVGLFATLALLAPVVAGCEMFAGESWEEAKRKAEEQRRPPTVGGARATPGVTTAGTAATKTADETLAALGIIQGPGSCGAGKSCTMTCPAEKMGGLPCTHTCGAGSRCTSACETAGCRQTCAAGANCTFVCPGGKCIQTCGAGASCIFTCPTKNCVQRCASGASCTKT